MRRILRATTAAWPLLAALTAPVWAIPQYLTTYLSVHPGAGSCQTCHVNSGGGSPYTAYGTKIKNRAGNQTVLQAIMAADGTVIPPKCVLPQVLQNNVCVTPVVTTCVPPLVLKNGACVTPTAQTCTLPQVFRNGVCTDPVVVPPVVTPPPGPVTNVPVDIASCGGGWPFSGRGIANNRYAAEEKWITSASVVNMTMQSSANVTGSVLATPTTQGGFIYAGDKGGSISKTDNKTGKAVWTVKASDLFGIPNAIARAAPAICNGMVIVAGWSLDLKTSNAAYVVALDQKDGHVRWTNHIETDTGAAIMQSPIIWGGTVYGGVGCVIAEIAQFFNGPGQPAPLCRGSVFALDVLTGKTRWKTNTVPVGISGGGVWSDTSALDTTTMTLFSGVGNSFTIPPAMMSCVLNMNGGGDVGTMCDSISQPSYHDSILALDARTGKPKWSKRDISHDAYGCGPNCVAAGGPPDADVLGVTLADVTINGTKVPAVITGLKNGTVIAFNRNTGDTLWAKNLGPGSPLGGVERALTTDGVGVYAPSMNFVGAEVSLMDGSTTTAGFWSKLDAATGAVLWQTANPTGYKSLSPMTLVAGGVVFGCSLDPDGMCYALDASNGHVIKEYKTLASNGGGVAINQGKMIVGTGYNGLNDLIGLGSDATSKQIQVWAVPGAPADPLVTPTTTPRTRDGDRRSGSDDD